MAGELSVTALIALLQQPDETVRLFAALRLRALGPKARAAVPALTALLASACVLDRRAAAWTLGAIGALAQAAVPALRQAQRDLDVKVCMFASQAIQQINAEPVRGRAA